MRVGIEFCRFHKEHNGGKCQVAYNLLKGFYENGHGDDIVCFCHEDLREVILKIEPNANVVIVHDFKGEKTIIPNRRKVGKCLGDLVKEQNIDVMLFTDKHAPIVKTKCKSILIAHDILVFIASKNKDIEFHARSVFMDKALLYIDFLLHDYIIAISDYDKNSMIKYIAKTNKIKRIYNPIVFPKYQNYQEKKYITALNIQHPHKNIMTLIRAFNEVKDKMDYDLILVGKEPPNIQEIKEYIEHNNLQSRVTITGFMVEERIKDIISKTRIYINPSLFEGFGMTTVEMMGSKIPIICADNSAQKEVTCGKGRYYFPAQDAHALALAIQDELDMPTSVSLLDEYANLMKDKYDYRVIASEYWDFFSECIEE